MTDKSQAEVLQKLQVLEQTLHAQSAQRASMQSQLMEIENASGELSSAKESYRIIGNIMVKAEPSKLKAELDERKASLQARISAVERQDKKLREEMERMQQSILGAA